MKYSSLFFVSFLAFWLSGCDIEELKDKLEGEFVDYGSPLAENTSKPSDPARTLPPNPAGCPDWKKMPANNEIPESNKITESITLPAGCRYDRVSLLIENQSNLTLDCNGAELNGINKEFRQAVDVPYSEADEPLSIGIRIISHETRPSGNITIKNCKVKNYITGIAVLTILKPETHLDLKNKRNPETVENYLRDHSLKNIRIENTSVNYNHKNGIYIGRYITGLVIDKTSVKYTSGAGLYLESGSQRNTIKNSTFSENGHSRYNVSKRVRLRMLAKDTREGIAIDSSAQNTIQNNTFSKNAGGGIFVYKNCYEHYQLATELPRYQSADNNLITGNRFDNQKIGIWIASRQSKDLKSFECGTPRIATDKTKFGETIFIYEDFAKHNIVTLNNFINVTNGVIIEDNDNTINNNSFSGSAKFDVIAGTKYRTEKLSQPVNNTVITNNQFNSSSSAHINLSYNPSNTTIKDNIPETVNQ